MTNEELKQVKVGKKVRIKGTTNGLSAFTGMVGTIKSMSAVKASGTTRLYFKEAMIGSGNQSIGSYCVYVNDVDLAAFSIKELNEEILALQEAINEKQSIIEYLTATGLEEYDENQHKVYKTLQLLKQDGLTDVEKSVLIAKMIN